jgi:hypothetical protein
MFYSISYSTPPLTFGAESRVLVQDSLLVQSQVWARNIHECSLKLSIGRVRYIRGVGQCLQPRV